MKPSIKDIATDLVWRLVYTPYRWGGDDPMSGFDCSGMVCEVLASIGLIGRNADFTAQGLLDHFRNVMVDGPYEGCLVFWLNDERRAVHVEYCISQDIAIGASGGNSRTVSVEAAQEQNAFIKPRPIRSRAGLREYVDPFPS